VYQGGLSWRLKIRRSHLNRSRGGGIQGLVILFSGARWTHVKDRIEAFLMRRAVASEKYV